VHAFENPRSRHIVERRIAAPRMKLHLYLNSYRPHDAERAAEVFSCFLDNARLPVLDKVFAFSEEPFHPAIAACDHVERIILKERLTFARWLEEADIRSRNAIAILANADIALTEQVARLREIFSASGTARPFVALTRYEETARGPELYTNPYWSQDVWAVAPRAEGFSPALLQQAAFPLGVPSCDNVLAWVAHCHGFTLHNPCLHVITLHRHRSAARTYNEVDRLLGNTCYVHPSPEVGVPSQLEFHMVSRGEVPVSDVRVVDIGRHRGASHLRSGVTTAPAPSAATGLRFVEGACVSLGRQVGEAPRHARDHWFWQFPCRTEQAAWDRHRALKSPPVQDGVASVYLGLPWATWIDCRHDAEQDLAALQPRLAALRAEVSNRGWSLRLHTVCQHIHWRRLLPLWRQLGVTDLWLSHAPPEGDDQHGMRIGSWPLFAVNVETPDRRLGLKSGKPAAERSVFASYRGGWMPHYRSLVRLEIEARFRGRDGWVIENTGTWHFNDVVYGHQVAGKTLSEVNERKEDVFRYNRLLSDSVFSLCPGGSGPNTLRLWESLALGSIPVVLSDGYRPPPVNLPSDAGDGPPPAWDEAVITHPEDDLATLEARLAALPAEARQRMHVSGMRLYDALRSVRCF
jgi:hypothetical protein